MRIAGTSPIRPVAAWLAAGCLSLATASAAQSPDGTLKTEVTREGRVLHVQATLDADAPTTVCYAVLADFDRLEEFVPGLRSSDVISAPGEPVVLHQVGVASAALFRVTLDVTLAVRVHPPERIEFERIEGNLRQMRGSWTISGDERHCAIVYRADIEPAFWVPPLIGPMLMRNQVEEQLEGVMQELHHRAASQSAP